jgi:glycosyltransferase involved in cell wall biosynthesis
MLYGIYPPPVGGVSTHVKRFVAFLRTRSVSFEFAHPNRASESGFPQLDPLQFFRRALESKARVVHVHDLQHRGMHVILSVLSLAFRKKIVITIHNEWFAENYRRLHGFRRLAARLCYTSVTRIISVNSEADFLFVPPDRIVHIPAFLPPTPEERDASMLPASIHELRERMRILLTANAFRILFREGHDLYGLDLSIDLMRRLQDDGINDVGLVFVIPDVGDQEYLDSMRERIGRLGLQDRFLLVTEAIPYPAVIDICDVFVRPTTSDGDAISVREALYAGVPTIASDAVRRPKGTVLFRSRDCDDLFAKTVAVIGDCRSGRRSELARFANYGERILDVYRELGMAV